MSKHETLEQIAERLAVALAEAEEMLREEHDARMEAVAQRDEARATKDMQKILRRKDMSKPELEQIAERLFAELVGADGLDLTALSIGERRTCNATILAVLREVEVRGEQRAAALGGALLDSAIERAEKAEAEVQALLEAAERTEAHADKMEAEVERLQAAVEYLLEEHGGSVNIRHIKEAPGWKPIDYCPWCGDEEPCRVGRRVAEILAAPAEEFR